MECNGEEKSPDFRTWKSKIHFITKKLLWVDDRAEKCFII